MSRYTIEEFYDKINDHIITVGGWKDDPGIGSVIKMCRLKPYQMLTDKKDRYNLKLHKHWVDEYGSSLFVLKTKLKVVLDDLTIDRKLLQCTDMYDGLSITQVSSISKLVWATKDKMIGFLGLDDYLRVFVWLDGQWVKRSPLLLGIEALKQIVKHRDMGYAMTMDDGWLMKWPASKELVSDCGASGVLPKEILDGE